VIGSHAMSTSSRPGVVLDWDGFGTVDVIVSPI
jgi:hypothetical protein